jgi:hypothetical protein
MMDTSKPVGFYSCYHDKLVRLVFKDGTEWVGMVTGLSGYDKKTQDHFDATVVIFTRKRLPLDEVAEIHEMHQPKWVYDH